MDRFQRPAVVGLAFAVLTVVAALVPYLLPSLGQSAVDTYYDYGLLGAWSVLVVAAVAIVVFASVYRRRSDPATAAGAGLVLGLAATALAALWVFAVPYDVVVQLSTTSLFEYHRWVLLASSFGIALAGAWYAREQGLL